MASQRGVATGRLAVKNGILYTASKVIECLLLAEGVEQVGADRNFASIVPLGLA
jgi:hypothetical protein